MAAEMDFGRVAQLHHEIYNFAQAGVISTRRLGAIALEIMTLRGQYENVLKSDAPKEQKEQAKRALEYLGKVEKLVIRAYAIRRATRSGWSTFPIPLVPPIVVNP